MSDKSLKLYHYVHCPFCIRVRMALGYFKMPYTSIVLPYNDEATPIKLTQKKMLPIVEQNQKVMNESLDIIKHFDKFNMLDTERCLSNPEFEILTQSIEQIGELVHSLAMPYWIWTPEFNNESRDYFVKKKEQKRGPFKDLVKNRQQFIEPLEKLLAPIIKKFKPYYLNKEISLFDVMLASHLWGLYTVVEYQLDPKLHQYLQLVGKQCHFSYHEDFWR
ncbi:MAG: glutaredoxin 2 [Bacteriovoracaceae bacterium]|nr:glutaredoxin 2 [Bacteriovoracaceae bacterium]